MGIIAEQMAKIATARLDAVANNVRDDDDAEGNAAERAARRLVKIDPKARIANVLVDVDAAELVALCDSVAKNVDDAALVAVAKVVGRGAAEVIGRTVAIRADQLLAMASFASV